MTRIIAVASGKGGVGKTTLVANLSSALAAFNRSVVAVDGNTTTPNLGLILGIPLYPRTLQDVMRGRASIREAIYYHEAGFRVVPSGISYDSVMIPEHHRLVNSVFRLLGEAEFILIDTAAGLGREAMAVIRSAEELLVVTSPDLSSITDALKLVKAAERHGTRPIGAVVNRIRRESSELSRDVVEGFLGLPVIGVVSEDRAVRRAAAEKAPVVTHYPRSLPARQLLSIASGLAGEAYGPRPVLDRLFGWLRP